MKFIILAALSLSINAYAKKGSDLYSSYIMTFGNFEKLHNCTDPDGKFNPILCEAYSKSCQLETKIMNPNRVTAQVKIQNWDTKNRPLIVAIAPEIDNTRYEIWPREDVEYTRVSDLPLNTRVRFYSLGRQGYQLSFLGESKVTEEGKMTIDYKDLKTKMIHIKKEIPKLGMVIREVRFDGVKVGPDTGQKISAGQYEVEVDLTIKDKPYKKKFSYSISEDEMKDDHKVLNLEIDSEGLKEETSKPEFLVLRLNYDKKANQVHLYGMNDPSHDSSERFVAKFDSITIDGSSNLKNHFNSYLGGGGLYSNDKNSQKILDHFKNKITANLKVVGECGETLRNDIKLIFNVYDSFDKLKKLGQLMINSQYEIIFVDLENKKTQFQANIGFDECKESPSVAHQLKSVKGNWGNLGEGPWGKAGWIEFVDNNLVEGRGVVFSLDDSGTYYNRFTVEGDMVRLKGTGLREKGTKSETDSEGCGGHYIDVEKVVKWKDVFDDKGIFKLPRYCPLDDSIYN